MATTVSDLIAMATSFSPGHITGIFAPTEKIGADLLNQGSVGAGFSIAKGITTTVRTFESEMKGHSISIDGVRVSNAPVSSYVADYYLKLATSPVFFQIDHRTEIPIGYGLGSSGAAALSLSYALNQSVRTDLTTVEAAQVAHCADLTCRTGLGTVAALFAGGYEIRLKPGAPGRGLTMKKDLHDYVAVIFCIAPISTETILKNPTINGIDRNKLSYRLLNKLKAMDNVEEFLDASYEFVQDLGLAKGPCEGPIEAIESAGFKCSVALYGQTVFTIVRREKTIQVRSCLNDFKGTLIESNIDPFGARMICEYDYAN
jgi:pantoate kinase